MVNNKFWRKIMVTYGKKIKRTRYKLFPYVELMRFKEIPHRISEGSGSHRI